MHLRVRMWSALAACVDFAHAALMAAWVLGLPLLFVRRWPSWTRAYCVYGITFVTLNLASRALLGECFLTTLARACWQAASMRGGPAIVPQEWFTVRLAEAVFRLTPSHRGVKVATEVLIGVMALGILASYRRSGHGRPPRRDRGGAPRRSQRRHARASRRGRPPFVMFEGNRGSPRTGPSGGCPE